MGLLRGVLGNGAELSLNVISFEFQPILIEGELVEKAFKVVRDILVFTNKRLIMVNKLGGFGNSKVECLTIPYSSIKKFSKECAGLFNKSGELKLWITGEDKPLCKTFDKEVNVNEVYQILSKYTLNC
jgi:hypothetical protein